MWGSPGKSLNSVGVGPVYYSMDSPLCLAQCGNTEILVNATELVGCLVEILEDRYYSYFAVGAALDRVIKSLSQEGHSHYPPQMCVDCLHPELFRKKNAFRTLMI